VIEPGRFIATEVCDPEQGDSRKRHNDIRPTTVWHWCRRPLYAAFTSRRL